MPRNHLCSWKHTRVRCPSWRGQEVSEDEALALHCPTRGCGEEDVFLHRSGKLEAFPRLCLLMGYFSTYFPLLQRENNHKSILSCRCGSLQKTPCVIS